MIVELFGLQLVSLLISVEVLPLVLDISQVFGTFLQRQFILLQCTFDFLHKALDGRIALLLCERISLEKIVNPNLDQGLVIAHHSVQFHLLVDFGLEGVRHLI